MKINFSKEKMAYSKELLMKLRMSDNRGVLSSFFCAAIKDFPKLSDIFMRHLIGKRYHMIKVCDVGKRHQRLESRFVGAYSVNQYLF